MTKIQLKQQIKKDKKNTPPYESIRNVNKFLKKIKILNPKVIDKEYLATNNLGQKNPFPLLGTLKFLNLIDDSGKPTEKLESLKIKGKEEYQKSLMRIIKEAYREMFDSVNVEAADEDTIYNQIRSVYKCSIRIANQATPLFLWLCGEAGIREAKVLRKRMPTVQRKVAVKKEAKRTTKKGLEEKPDAVEDVDYRRSAVRDILKINIDSNWEEKKIELVFDRLEKLLSPTEKKRKNDET